MPWIMFNGDNTFCSVSETRWRSDQLALHGEGNFQVYLEPDSIDDFPEDEVSMLVWDPETNRAVFNEEYMLVGSNRHKESLLEWLEAYRGVPLDNIPDGQEQYNNCVSFLGKERTDSYWADGFIDSREMAEIEALLNEGE